MRHESLCDFHVYNKIIRLFFVLVKIDLFCLKQCTNLRKHFMHNLCTNMILKQHELSIDLNYL